MEDKDIVIYPFVDFMRFICALMVVAIHVHPGYDYNNELGFFLTQILPEIAVPFFFVTSSFFFTRSCFKKNPNIAFRKYIKRLLKIYILWSLIYMNYTYFDPLVRQPSEFIPITKGLIISFIFLGSSEHLWYFPALIFSIIVIYLFISINKIHYLFLAGIVLYILGLLGCSYFYIGKSIPIFNTLLSEQLYNLVYTPVRRIFFMALPFTIVGSYIFYNQEKIFKYNTRLILKIIAVLITLFIIEILLINRYHLARNNVLTIWLLPLVIAVFSMSLRTYNINFVNKYMSIFKKLSNGIYYAHPLFMLIISVLFKNTFNIDINEYGTPYYIIVVSASGLFTQIIRITNNKKLLILIS